MNKTVIGIAGLMGSGKTTAGTYFMKKGALFINTDKLVADLYQPRMDGSKKINSFLGGEFLKSDGSVNKRKLSRYVFNDLNKLKILNNLIHPLVLREVENIMRNDDRNIVVIEATYFSEKMLGKLINKLLFIDCPRTLLVLRINKKKKMERHKLDLILSSQKIPEKCDFKVDNGKNLKHLFTQLKEIWLKISADTV